MSKTTGDVALDEKRSTTDAGMPCATKDDLERIVRPAPESKMKLNGYVVFSGS